MPSSRYTPKRAAPTNPKLRRPGLIPLIAAAAVICLGLIIIPTLGTPSGQSVATIPPAASVSPAPTPTPEPTPTPTPTPEPTPTPVVHDFSQSAPEVEAVDMSYFSDALFIGDSRTDGLRLYSGIEGGTFYCYKGLTIFEVDDAKKKVVELDGKKYTVTEALAQRQYAKIYISLGVNELGYFNDQLFEDTFGSFLDVVKTLQPDAIIYLENLVPINPDVCKEKKQPYYINNDRVADYNAIFDKLGLDKQVVLLDVAAALSDESGVLPRDGTVDGVHFTKTWYKKWLSYLMSHTVDAEAYISGQTTAKGDG